MVVWLESGGPQLNGCLDCNQVDPNIMVDWPQSGGPQLNGCLDHNQVDPNVMDV